MSRQNSNFNWKLIIDEILLSTREICGHWRQRRSGSKFQGRGLAANDVGEGIDRFQREDRGRADYLVVYNSFQSFTSNSLWWPPVHGYDWQWLRYFNDFYLILACTCGQGISLYGMSVSVHLRLNCNSSMSSAYPYHMRSMLTNHLSEILRLTKSSIHSSD